MRGEKSHLKNSGKYILEERLPLWRVERLNVVFEIEPDLFARLLYLSHL